MIVRQIPRIAAAVVLLAYAGIDIPLRAQGDAGASSDAVPLEVTVAGDSAPGWVPSEQLVVQAVDTVARFYNALDEGDYPRAYALLTAENQKKTPAARFREDNTQFNHLAGKLVRRRMITSSWSKDPPGAPGPGIYAVFDLASQYTNVDRQCGLLMLYQPPTGGAFKLLRIESNFLDNRTAQQIELSQSHQALLDAWAKTSANCAKFSWDAPP